MNDKRLVKNELLPMLTSKEKHSNVIIVTKPKLNE